MILFVGDGMGISTVTAARVLEGQQQGKPGEENFLFFETLPYTALSKTYNTNQQVADSAGTMSAMMTGIKTKAGVIAVTERVRRGDATTVPGNEARTLLEIAELAGKWTGVVTNATVTHATPASAYAHSADRNWESDANLPEGVDAPDIASQLIDFPQKLSKQSGRRVDGPEVVFGGGRANFLPKNGPDGSASSPASGKRLDGRNLIGEWLATRQQSAYVEDRAALERLDLDKTRHVLGLFGTGHMKYEVERQGEDAGQPSLSEMTGKAIDLLSRSKSGFVLVVEGSRIDQAHHAGNAYRALTEAIELANAVRVAYEKTDARDTLIVVTADHSHTLTMGGYPTRGNEIMGLVVHNDGHGEAEGDFARDLLGKPFTTLGYANGTGYAGGSSNQEEGHKIFPHRPQGTQPITGTRPDLAAIYKVTPETQRNEVFADHLQEVAVPYNLETHGGEDVGIWASGPRAHLFHGTIEQHVVFHILAHALGFELPSEFRSY